MTLSRSAGGIVINPMGQVLVVNQNGNSWSLPKGHLDGDETELEAARREIYEESGVSELHLIKELGSYERTRIGLQQNEDTSQFKRITLFLFKTMQIALRPIDPQNPEARWVDPREVAAMLTHPKDKEFFEQQLKTIQTLLRI